MRIAVLADIHGNVRALEAVIADLRERRVDRVVNLGDCLSGPLEAADTAALLMRQDWLTVRGNHDRWLVETPPAQLSPSDRAAADQIDDAVRDWLRKLPATRRLEDVLLVHGTATSDTTYLTERVTPHGVTLRPDEEIARDLDAFDGTLVLCGHSHVPRLVALSDGQTVFNPGSVGLPAYDDDHPAWHAMEVGSPHARYGVIERTASGWRFEHHAVDYDWRGAADAALNVGRRDWAHALSTGFALRS
ncbi:MAG TPA: metallophosphoesterase family protein [Beijerinckiaceae bacterium]|jgi:putative phosphoesterase